MSNAIAARLREPTGVDRLNPMTGTLNTATRNLFNVRRLTCDDRIVRAPAGPSRTEPIPCA